MKDILKPKNTAVDSNIECKPHFVWWVESLVGSGHLNTVRIISKRLMERGWDVTIMTGSRLAKMPTADFGQAKIIDLPGCKGDFKTHNTRTHDAVTKICGDRITEDHDWRARYKEVLLENFRKIKAANPNVVLGTEFWPVRRGDFDFAMMPLMEEAQGIAKYCLLRDWVQMSVTNTPAAGSPEMAINVLKEHYVTKHNKRPVMVRTMSSMMKLRESFPEAKQIKENTLYTGSVTPTRDPVDNLPNNLSDNVLVTSGGGWMEYARDTYKAALQAASDPNLNADLKAKTWRILLPADTPEDIVKELTELAIAHDPSGKHIIVEPNREDFKDMTEKAALIITHGGDTIGEVAKYGVPMVVTPRINPGEVLREEAYKKGVPAHTYRMAPGKIKNEQLARTMAFANRQFCELARPEDLPNMVQIINEAMEHPKKEGMQTGFSGADVFADIVTQQLNKKLRRHEHGGDKNWVAQLARRSKPEASVTTSGKVTENSR